MLANTALNADIQGYQLWAQDCGRESWG